MRRGIVATLWARWSVPDEGMHEAFWRLYHRFGPWYFIRLRLVLAWVSYAFRHNYPGFLISIASPLLLPESSRWSDYFYWLWRDSVGVVSNRLQRVSNFFISFRFFKRFLS